MGPGGHYTGTFKMNGKPVDAQVEPNTLLVQFLREQLRLTFMELIRRDFLNKKLNLPSDTPIDLTLDTTWNANQIISDLLEYARRGETPVLTTDETP